MRLGMGACIRDENRSLVPAVKDDHEAGASLPVGTKRTGVGVP